MADQAKLLVMTPKALEFVERASTKTGRFAMFGDASKYSRKAYNQIEWANAAMESAIDMLVKIGDDPTITPVMKHANAKILAEKTIASISGYADTMTKMGNDLLSESAGEIGKFTEYDPVKTPLYSEWRGWMKQNANSPEFPRLMQGLMKKYPDLVTVLHHSPHVLTGLSSGVHEKLAIDGLELHIPKSTRKLMEGDELVALGGRYSKTYPDIRASFYNSDIASQASRRADVNSWKPPQVGAE